MSIVALTAALLAASPAPAPAPAPIAPAATQMAAESSDDTRRVCIVHTPSGSFIERKTCQTRAAWVDQGTDPLAKR